MKRRIIYISDAQWSSVIDYAKVNDMSASEVIRAAIDYELNVHWPASLIKDGLASSIVSPQAQRDAILRRINKGG